MEFIASMRRIMASMKRPLPTNLSLNQRVLRELQGLLKSAAGKLEDLFVQLLVEESTSVEPLHFVTKGK